MNVERGVTVNTQLHKIYSKAIHAIAVEILQEKSQKCQPSGDAGGKVTDHQSQ